MAEGKLFVISGPSGVGKGTLISKVMEDIPGFWKSVSATTRAPREGELDGREYFFVTEDDFKQGIEAGDFLEHARYSGNCYGTPRKAVQERLDAGQNVILEIEVQGARQIKEMMPDAVQVFIEPPSLEDLERRLRGRGTEDESTIARRMDAAKMELASKMEYNFSLVNDDLSAAVEQLEGFIKGL